MTTVTIERETLQRVIEVLEDTGEGATADTLRAALAAQPATNPWREALIDELVVTGIYRHMHEDHPRQAVQDVINWHTSVALDPAVSSEAQALVDRGKAAQPTEPVAERARQLWNTIKILGLSNDKLALFAIRTALTSQLAPPTVALKSVHLTRDVQGMCKVLVNERVAIRDNGDIIDHFATPDWFAAPPAPAAVPHDKTLLTIAEREIGFDGGLQTVNAIDLIRFGAAVARAMIAAGDKP